jgi:hypothetical protein
MATGRLYTTTPGAGFVTPVPTYVVPTGYYSVFNVSITNTNATPVTFRLALSSSATPAASEYIEYGATIIPNGVFERTGLVADAGKQVVVLVSTSGVNVNVWGIETSTT